MEGSSEDALSRCCLGDCEVVRSPRCQPYPLSGKQEVFRPDLWHLWSVIFVCHFFANRFFRSCKKTGEWTIADRSLRIFSKIRKKVLLLQCLYGANYLVKCLFKSVLIQSLSEGRKERITRVLENDWRIFGSSRQLELCDWILPPSVLGCCVNCKVSPHVSLQDFICIAFLEISGQSRTLASRHDTTAEQLSQQCAEKFEVAQPKDYGLFVYVDDQWLQLDKDALPHHIKASLLKSETKKDFHFIYKPIDHKTPPVPIVKESDFS